MVVRYSGKVSIWIKYEDAFDAYRCRVCPNGRYGVKVTTALSEEQKRVLARDSKEAYHQIARAALSFVASENEEIDSLAERDEEGNLVVFTSKPEKRKT